MLLLTLRSLLPQSCYNIIDSYFVNFLEVAHMQHYELFRFTKLMTQFVSKSMFINHKMYARDNTFIYEYFFATFNLFFKVISL